MSILRNIKIHLDPGIRWIALISTLLVVPFMLLEWVNRRTYHESFPLPLFGLLWLLSTASMLVLLPVVRNQQAKNGRLPKAFTISIRLFLFFLIAGVLAGILVDQWPCFMGIANCD
jgi:hypothetical protein